MTGSTPSRLVASPARAAQDRLRSLGLPLLLEPSVRARALLDRTAALLVGLAVACVGYALSVQATSRFTAAELADEAAIRELFAARAELASLGATTSPSRLERALERLEAAQQASRRVLAQAA